MNEFQQRLGKWENRRGRQRDEPLPTKSSGAQLIIPPYQARATEKRCKQTTSDWTACISTLSKRENSVISLKIRPSLIACWSLKHTNYLILQTDIIYQATEILGSYKLALRWFESPARGLNGKSPCQALSRKSGHREIHLLLKRIDHGIYI